MLTPNDNKISAHQLADFVLDVATYLLACGAHCGRVSRNINRMTQMWGFEVHFYLTFKGVLATITEKGDNSNTITRYRKSPAHNVHFDIISRISSLSWKVHDYNMTFEEAIEDFNEIKAIKPYKDLVVSVAIGCSCAGLCLFSHGNYINALVTFIAAFIGFWTKIFLTKKEFNPMIGISAAAFMTTAITCTASLYNIGASPQAAMATAILYLIPGVPLINSTIDLIEGYLTSAINRMLFSGFILLCIASGMTICITLFGINNF